MKTTATTTLVLGAAAACLFFTSCETTSISNPGSGGGSSWGHSRGANAFYSGELNSLDVLGVPDGEISESAIASALGKSSGSALRIPGGSRIMLVQSGAVHPDPALQKAMTQYYDIVPFSGIPTKRDSKTNPGNDAKRLRMAAAKAGVRHTVVVWGTLESTTADLATTGVAWIPVAGQLLADEHKATRIVTTAVLMDTASGQWRSISSEPIVRRTISSDLTRNKRWDRQVEALKAESYPALANRVSTL